MLFQDRMEAGKKLAEKLIQYQGRDDVLVLALPRGGVVLGYEVSKILNVPLDIILVRKLGVPWHEELAMGAIATGGIRVLNQNVISSMNIAPEIIEQVVAKEQQELERRNQLYRGGKPFPNVKGKIVILVDDGIATGATMRAAIQVVKAKDPAKIVVAVPLASTSVFQDLAGEMDELVVLETPEPFFGIGMWYATFPQLSDEDVINLLNDANKHEY